MTFHQLMEAAMLSNENKSRTEEYKEHRIQILCLREENGWTVEVEVIKEGDAVIPKWRDYDNTYPSAEVAIDAGRNWAVTRIDGRLRQSEAVPEISILDRY